MSRWSKAFYVFAIPVSALAGLGYANGVIYCFMQKHFIIDPRMHKKEKKIIRKLIINYK